MCGNVLLWDVLAKGDTSISKYMCPHPTTTIRSSGARSAKAISLDLSTQYMDFSCPSRPPWQIKGLARYPNVRSQHPRRHYQSWTICSNTSSTTTISKEGRYLLTCSNKRAMMPATATSFVLCVPQGPDFLVTSSSPSTSCRLTLLDMPVLCTGTISARKNAMVESLGDV
jgi:hypothetical protein